MFCSFVGSLGEVRLVLVGTKTEIHLPQKIFFYFHDGNMKGLFRLCKSSGQACVHFFFVETWYLSTYEGQRRNSVLSGNNWAGYMQLSQHLGLSSQ